MGLGAFKVLGGVYAVAQLLREAWWAIKGEHLAPVRLMDADVQAFAKNFTFVCASAGNHGLAVATGARLFGAKARIHLANSVPQSFSHRLEERGAEVVRSGATYEDALVGAGKDADTTGAMLLADGAWSGYTYIPTLVMEGYTVIAEEMRHSFAELGAWPTHVFLQAGVGGLAGAVAYGIRQLWPQEKQPEIIIVEPDVAQCLAASHKAGELVTVTGAESNMGRLDCKEASLIAFEILETSNVTYMAVSDMDAQLAADQLAAAGFPTTPSGAAGFAGLLKRAPVDASSLIIVSEGPE